MPNTQATPELRLLFVEQVYFCALYVVFLFDWVSRLPNETRAYWIQRPRLPTLLYVLCRYVPIIAGAIGIWAYTSENTWKTCSKVFLLPIAFATVSQITALGSLVLRTHTLGGDSLVTLRVHHVLLAGVGIFQLYAVFKHLSMRPFDMSPPPFAQTSGCFAHPTSAIFVGYFSFPFALSLYLTVLAYARVWRMSTHASAVSFASSQGRRQRSSILIFLRAIWTKNVWQYHVISLAYLSAMVVFASYYDHTTRARLSMVQAALVYFLPSLLCCNMLLKEAKIELRAVGSWPASFLSGFSGSQRQTHSIGFAKPRASLYGRAGTAAAGSGPSAPGDDSQMSAGTSGPPGGSAFTDSLPKPLTGASDLNLCTVKLEDEAFANQSFGGDKELFFEPQSTSTPRRPTAVDRGHAEATPLPRGASMVKRSDEDREGSTIGFAPVKQHEILPVIERFEWTPRPV